MISIFPECFTYKYRQGRSGEAERAGSFFVRKYRILKYLKYNTCAKICDIFNTKDLQ